MPINSRIENKIWNIHKMEYRAAMRLNDLVTCTWVCSFYKMPLPHPHPNVHPGWLGSQVRESVLVLWWPPSAVYLSSPREETRSLWRTRNWSWRRKRRGGMHGQGTKAPAAHRWIYSDGTQVELCLNSIWPSQHYSKLPRHYYLPLTDKEIGSLELSCGSQIISGGVWT